MAQEDAPSRDPPPAKVARVSRRGSGTPMAVLKPRTLLIPNKHLLFRSPWPSHGALPRAHPLIALSATPDGARALAHQIWGPAAPDASSSFRASVATPSARLRLHPAQHLAVAPLLQDLLRRARSVPYLPILQSTCPMPEAARGHPSPLVHTCPARCVANFVLAVLGRVLPPGLIGPTTAQCVRRRVAALVSLRRFEALSVHDLLHGASTKGCGWLYAWCAAAP